MILTYKTIKSEEESDKDGPIIFSFYMNDLQLQNNREKLLILNNLKIDAKVTNFCILNKKCEVIIPAEELCDKFVPPTQHFADNLRTHRNLSMDLR